MCVWFPFFYDYLPCPHCFHLNSKWTCSYSYCSCIRSFFRATQGLGSCSKDTFKGILKGKLSTFQSVDDLLHILSSSHLCSVASVCRQSIYSWCSPGLLGLSKPTAMVPMSSQIQTCCLQSLPLWCVNVCMGVSILHKYDLVLMCPPTCWLSIKICLPHSHRQRNTCLNSNP